MINFFIFNFFIYLYFNIKFLIEDITFDKINNVIFFVCILLRQTY